MEVEARVDLDSGPLFVCSGLNPREIDLDWKPSQGDHVNAQADSLVRCGANRCDHLCEALSLGQLFSRFRF